MPRRTTRTSTSVLGSGDGIADAAVDAQRVAKGAEHAGSTEDTPASSSGPSGLVTVMLVALWYSSSMLAITTSKMTMQMVKVPLTLCSAQFMSATLIAGLCLHLQRIPSSIGKDCFSLLCGTALTYTLGFFFTNLAFSLANASFVETVKSGEPISTVALAFGLLGEREQADTYMSLVPVIIGVGLASSGEAGGGAAAFAATVASNFGFSARAVFAKQLKRDCPKSSVATSDVSLFFHISWMGLLGLLPLVLLQEWATLGGALETPGFDHARFAIVMGLNGLMYTAYNQFSFMVLSRVATSTHAVLNVCRRVCVIGVTTLAFGTPLSLLNCTGMVVAVLGMFWFTHAKTRGAAKKQV